MKKIYILFAVAAMSLYACNDWLEEGKYGAATEEEIVNNEANLALLVGQAYADVKWLHDHWGYWGINTLTTDESVCPIRMPGGDWNDGGYWKNMNSHRWTVEDKAFRQVWDQSISGAVLCNKILANLKGQQSSAKDTVTFNRYVAELSVLRSYYFFTIFDCFGRIPYTEEFDEYPPVSAKPLMESAEVWKKLVTNLESSKNKLPKTNETASYGRATWGFANALLARLYLNAESYGVTGSDLANAYNNCAKTCQELIDSKLYSIEPDFFNNFKIDNSGSKENIFVIVEDGTATFDVRYVGSMMNKLRLQSLTLSYGHQQAWGLIEKPWNGFCAPAEFINKYAPEDRRGAGNEGKGTKNEKQWGWFVGPVYLPDGSIAKDEKDNSEVIITPEIKSKSGVYSLDSASRNAGARLLKYEVDKSKKYAWGENDFVLFRYADVLYMQAEAFVRGGTCEGGNLAGLVASPDFQLIRTRVGLTPYVVSDLTLDEFLDERGREFAWENVRHRDLVRFGKFADGAWSGWGAWRNVKSGEHLNWFPIPGAALRKSQNGVWTQNKGYEEKQ
jgi:hypothetical protein